MDEVYQKIFNVLNENKITVEQIEQKLQNEKKLWEKEGWGEKFDSSIGENKDNFFIFLLEIGYELEEALQEFRNSRWKFFEDMEKVSSVMEEENISEREALNKVFDAKN